MGDKGNLYISDFRAGVEKQGEYEIAYYTNIEREDGKVYGDFQWAVTVSILNKLMVLKDKKIERYRMDAINGKPIDSKEGKKLVKELFGKIFRAGNEGRIRKAIFSI